MEELGNAKEKKKKKAKKTTMMKESGGGQNQHRAFSLVRLAAMQI